MRDDGFIIYNKLVRDKIPEQIAQSGRRAVMTIVRGEEELQAMRNKIIEEANELTTAKTREEIASEIADLYEIIDAYRQRCGIKEIEVVNIQNKKRSKSGGFVDGKFLISVSNDTLIDMVKRRT